MTKTRENISVLVFKDDRTSRSFRISLAWLSAAGIFAGLVCAVALTCAVVALKNYRMAKNASPAKIAAMEQEIEELRKTNLSLETRAHQEPVSTAPPVSVPETARQQVKPVLFSALPPESAAAIPDRASLPISISSPVVFWKKNALAIRFSIQYTKGDGGNQQGRIVLVARGPELVMAYPDNIFNPAGAATLITPSRGEFFSVSRFREVYAEFGPVSSHARLKEVEIMIFNQEGQIIFSEKAVPQAAARVVPQKAGTINE